MGTKGKEPLTGVLEGRITRIGNTKGIPQRAAGALIITMGRYKTCLIAPYLTRVTIASSSTSTSGIALPQV